MIPSWLREHARLRLLLRSLAALALAAGVGGAAYLALVTPSRETHETRRELQREATTVCDFVGGVDGLLQLALDPKVPAPTTATGESFRLAFQGLQRLAQSVAASPLCANRPVTVLPTPPATPTGSPRR